MQGGVTKKGKRQLQSWAHSDSTRAAKSAVQRRVLHGAAATVIHTTPMGHDQEGGNEERESGRVGLGEKDVLSNVVRTTELLAAAAASAGRLVISPS